VVAKLNIGNNALDKYETDDEESDDNFKKNRKLNKTMGNSAKALAKAM